MCKSLQYSSQNKSQNAHLQVIDTQKPCQHRLIKSNSCSSILLLLNLFKQHHIMFTSFCFVIYLKNRYIQHTQIQRFDVCAMEY